ncbi:MAG: endonuclease/exonuclease/phosphatase family protein [Planctomycetaceae bacterium]
MTILGQFVANLLLGVGGLAAEPASAIGDVPQTVRVATFNISFHRSRGGELAEQLAGTPRKDPQRIAAILQEVRPDIVLLNEFDYDPELEALTSFEQRYLAVPQGDREPLQFAYRYAAPVNTGEPTGLDMNRDGSSDGPNDAYGFGRYPGQYGMVLLSRYPIDVERVRSFRKLLWKSMPGALLPVDPASSEPYYSPEQLAVFRLSSKSHWDVPVLIGERMLHVLAAHPTPPSFDGPEDRHGRRNHDEIRLWADYLSPDRDDYLVDDDGQSGGLLADAAFVIVGDLNADPHDGESANGAIAQLLEHPRVRAEPVPMSTGAAESANVVARANREHRGDARHDTANFSSPNGPGNLRVDYVLPSRELRIVASGVYWPAREEAGHELLRATDHRLVWVDVAW